MAYFIDTNVFLRVAVKENEKVFIECFNFLKTIKEGRIKTATSNLVFAEIVWSLSTYYKFPRAKIIATIEGFRNLKIQMIDKFQSELALELFKSFPVKYVDCLIASVKEVHSKKWVVVSYDKDFDKLSVIRKEPGEVVKELEGR